MRYEVQTWNWKEYSVDYHTVDGLSSYEEARDLVQSQYPDEKVIAVSKRNEELD